VPIAAWGKVSRRVVDNYRRHAKRGLGEVEQRAHFYGTTNIRMTEACGAPTAFYALNRFLPFCLVDIRHNNLRAMPREAKGNCSTATRTARTWDHSDIVGPYALTLAHRRRARYEKTSCTRDVGMHDRDSAAGCQVNPRHPEYADLAS